MGGSRQRSRRGYLPILRVGGTDLIVKEQPVEPFAGFAGVGLGSGFRRPEMIILNEIAGFVSAIYFARVLDFGLGE